MNMDSHRKPAATADLRIEEEIRQRAYELFEVRGGQEGYELEDWLRAEEEILGPQERCSSGHSRHRPSEGIQWKSKFGYRVLIWRMRCEITPPAGYTSPSGDSPRK